MMAKPIEKLDRQNFPGIGRDIDRALAEVAKLHGVAISVKPWRVWGGAAEATISLGILQPNELAAVLGRASELCCLDRPMEAEHLLRERMNVGIGDSSQLAAFEFQLGMALRQQGRNFEAVSLFDAAQSRAPDLPGVDFARSVALQQSGRIEEAALSLRKAVTREPDHAAAHACLAVISAELGDFATASESGLAALVREPDEPLALLALAIVDIETRSFSAARERLARTVSNPAFVGHQGVAFALVLAADAYDRQGQFAEAFALYRASNARLRGIYAAKFSAVRLTGDIERCIGGIKKSPRWSAPANPVAAADGPRRHVFLLGFTRSGTTLLETILAMSPQVVHADERDFLSDSTRGLDVYSEAGLDRLDRLEESEISQRRDAYWRSVRSAGFRVAGKAFVDKMPFHSLKLPLIFRLFPSARVIFAVRDPRDVVLSCFRRRFSITRATFEFHDLDDCARFYASVMELVELCREKLPLDVHEHRYEDTVADFESSVRAVCGFIGVDWSDGMRDFHRTARDVTRASAAQVRRGLYADGTGQWRRYRDELAPIFPILAPWAARFGYAAE